MFFSKAIKYQLTFMAYSIIKSYAATNLIVLPCVCRKIELKLFEAWSKINRRHFLKYAVEYSTIPHKQGSLNSAVNLS